MNEFYRAKFDEMFLEFTRYLITHPDFGENIPQGAEVILLDRRDSGYTKFILETAPKESSGEQVVFIDIGELAPIRSRLRRPRIVSRPPAIVPG